MTGLLVVALMVAAIWAVARSRRPTLVPCKACGREVASTAPTCPNCGFKLPGRRGSGLKLALGVVVVFAVFGALFSGGSREPAPAPAKPAAPAPVVAATATTPPAPAAPAKTAPAATTDTAKKSKAKKTAATGSDDSRFEKCRAKLKQAQKLDMLYDLDWHGSDEPRVVVGPTFFSVPIDAKQGFADTVNCFLMAGHSDKYINFDLLDWRTGKAVGRYKYGQVKMN